MMTLTVSSHAVGVTTHHRVSEGLETTTTERIPGNPTQALNPMETILAALNGCIGVVAAMVARQHEWSLTEITVKSQGTFDPRAVMGEVTDGTTFERIVTEVVVSGALSAHEVALLASEVERRCPVQTLLRRAGVPTKSTWRAQVF